MYNLPFFGNIFSGQYIPPVPTSIAIAITDRNKPLTEELTSYVFTINRTTSRNITTTVDYITSNVSNTVSSDFVGDGFPSGTIVFDPQETTKTVTISVVGRLAASAKSFTFAFELVNAIDSDGVFVVVGDRAEAYYGYALPSTLNSNIRMWLDASDLSTISETNNNVSQWRDKSGYSRHANQGTAANQPTYIASTPGSGRPGIYFDGANSGMIYTGNLAAPYSIFIVTNMNRPTSGAIVTITGSGATGAGGSDDAGSNGPFLSRSNTHYNLSSNGNGFSVISFPNSSELSYLNKDNLIILSSHFQSSNHRLNINRGTPLTSSGANVVTMFSTMSLGYQVMFGRHITGTIHEMIIYQGLTVAQWESNRVEIENYLQAKWY